MANNEVIVDGEVVHCVGCGAKVQTTDKEALGYTPGNILKPMLARGELHLIGATTIDEYRKYMEKDKALERRFQRVMVHEPSVEDTITILRGLSESLEIHHGVRIHDNALVAAAKLSDRYITDRYLPVVIVTVCRRKKILTRKKSWCKQFEIHLFPSIL